jgi:formylmethanofuran dehydrogenase subunit E
MGVKAAARAVKEMHTKSTGMEEVVAIVETNSCFSDGVQMVTGCSFGNNALIYHDFGKTAFTLAKRTGDAVRIALKGNGLSMEQREPEAMKLFQKVVKDRTGTPEEAQKLRNIWVEVSFKMLEVPDEELFTIHHTRIEVPSYARIFASVRCSICGENIMEPRTRFKDGKPVCIGCAGHEYYRLAGDGMSLIHL